jgi:hypothetical protein
VFEVWKADSVQVFDNMEKADDKKEPKGKYGDVEYADEKNKKYPLDTEEHIRAAWNYIHKEKNQSGYTAEELAAIEKKIVAAWKDKIDQKGMYAVAQLAQLVDVLASLQQCSEWEESMEGDKSTIPDQLKDAVKNLSSILRDMVTEETAELTADDDDVELSNKTADLIKAGARNSKSDMEKIQAMHDSTVALGADCSASTDKHAHTVDLSKLADLETRLTKIAGENSALKKRVDELEALPKPPKAAIKALSKTEDIPIIHKQEEEPKDPFSAIKKVHSGGGKIIHY